MKRSRQCREPCETAGPAESRCSGAPAAGPWRARWGSWVCLVLAIAVVGARGQQLPETHEEFPLDREPAVLFREYLARTPWIRYIAYRRALSRVIMSVAESPGDPENLVPRRPLMSLLERFEAGWQPEGFYLRVLDTEKGEVLFKVDGSPSFHPIPKGLEKVRGSNRYYYWTLYPGHMSLGVTFRTNTAGGKGYYHASRAMHDAMLKCDLRLGLDELGPGQLRWISDTVFEVEPVTVVRPYPGGRGEIVRFDARGRPAEIVYETSAQNTPRRSYRVVYSYLPERPFPPWQYVVEERDPREGLLRHTNYLDDIEFGLDPAAPEGYFPDRFRRVSEPLTRFAVVSNEVTYEVGIGGQWRPVEPAPPPDTFAELVKLTGQSQVYRSVLAAGFLAGVLLWGLVWWYRRRTRIR